MGLKGIVIWYNNDKVTILIQSSLSHDEEPDLEK